MINEDAYLEQKPAENELPEMREKIDLPIELNCSVSQKVNDFVNETKNVLENTIGVIKSNIDVDAKEVNNLSLSFENQTIHDVQPMIVDYVCETQNLVQDALSEQPQNDNSTINKINKDCSIEELEINVATTENELLSYDWTVPKLVCTAAKEFKPTKTCENFTKGCQWSPDGTCILIPSEDFRIRIFELPRDLYSGKLPENFISPPLESTLKVKEGGTIYDSCWFPYMNSWDPSTCCFLSTSQYSPIHLWDAFTGDLRATYRAYNQVDEVEAAISIQFTDSGGQIWSGYRNALRSFDTDRPGRQTNTIYLKKDFPNVSGVVSCIRENPTMTGLLAFGTYSKCIGLYKDGPLCSFETSSGVTQIEFSPCGTKLYSAVRRGSEFLCWDLRYPGTVLYSLQNRQSDTNQRIYFSISYSGEEVVSAGTDGAVRVWKIPSEFKVDEDLNAIYKIQISKDCINGVDLHKNLPILAVSTGTRIVDEEEIKIRDNSVRFYWLSNR